jgi:hypothetical protein
VLHEISSFAADLRSLAAPAQRLATRLKLNYLGTVEVDFGEGLERLRKATVK